MQQYQPIFNSLMGVKPEPNDHENHLFNRGQKYIQKLSKIPGIEMIAIVNSLSMYTTHQNSDIDLFIVTKPNMIWFVRFFSTMTLWWYGVWRKGEDISENFCLSFFVTTGALDLSKIAIEKDIYLYYWIYYMKPVIIKNDTYEKFLDSNTWVKIDDEQKKENHKYIINNDHVYSDRNTWVFYITINTLIRYFLLPKTLKSYHSLTQRDGIIISDNILKFHNEDKRKKIRDTILEKNFDK